MLDLRVDYPSKHPAFAQIMIIKYFQISLLLLKELQIYIFQIICADRSKISMTWWSYHQNSLPLTILRSV